MVCSDGEWKWNWFSGTNVPSTQKPSVCALAVVEPPVLVVTMASTSA
jgi:hypothetical protein